jgi:hypothetical protein
MEKYTVGPATYTMLEKGQAVELDLGAKSRDTKQNTEDDAKIVKITSTKSPTMTMKAKMWRGSGQLVWVKVHNTKKTKQAVGAANKRKR